VQQARTIRIVLLEDNRELRTVLSTLLKKRGYEVRAFPDPTICPLQLRPECRCSRHEACADVILTDLDMPGMNGLQFIENQRAKDCKCRHIAIMSGNLPGELTARARELGCRVFSKPFDPPTLFRWLDEVESDVHPRRRLADWLTAESADTSHAPVEKTSAAC